MESRGYLEGESPRRAPDGSRILARSPSRKTGVPRYSGRFGLEAADLSDSGGKVPAVVCLRRNISERRKVLVISKAPTESLKSCSSYLQ